MEGLALYLLKSALCVAVFFGVYWCFLKNQTFFRFNRYFLISGLICAVFLPFYTYTYEVRLAVSGIPDVGSLTVPVVSQESFFADYVLIGYALVACFLLARQVSGLIKIKKVVAKAGYRSIKECRLVNTSEFKSSFSVFNYIFFDTSEELSDTEKKMILRHELAHVKQRHWADLLLAQLFCTLQWFNPLAWLYLKAIRQNHEFLADEAVLQQGNSVAGYRAVLVNHYVGTRVFAISSSFYHYPQQRIKMLARPSSGWFNKMAVVIVLPAIAIFLWAFSEAKVVLKEPRKVVESVVTAKERTVQHTNPAFRSDSLRVFKQKTLPAKKETTLAKENRTRTQVALEKSSQVNSSVDPQQVDPQQTASPQKVSSVDSQVGLNSGSSTAVPLPPKEAQSPAQPLYFLDGVELTTGFDRIDPKTIAAISVIKNEKAVAAYGERGRNGVILISTKKENQRFAPLN
ncbi:hypothetical protein OQX61_14760 [Pedobacter sp. PLR]|uniref:M56 family metallopeptidase n=1 Tax=Pedobacter sp. PLR TaxID=2994465 RepID=UPI0022464016|nr:M56 family metallopeptidase [Pedobacter sp. PLR]MCX2452535.1 hypothetical protein [Pedobacter sp. PLR]